MKNFLQSKFGITIGRRKSYENPETNSSEPLIIPFYYSQCSTLDEKIAWLHSERGQSVLQNRPVPLQYYKNGRIFRLLEEPIWKKKLEEWLYETPQPPTAPVLSLNDEIIVESTSSSSSSSSSLSSLPVASLSVSPTVNIFGLSLPKTEDDAEKERRDTRFNEADHPLSLTSLSSKKQKRKEYKEKYYQILKNSLNSSIYFSENNLPSFSSYNSSYTQENLSLNDTLADIFEPSNHFFSNATLTDDQIYHLYQYGYVVLRGVLSQELVDSCVIETEREIFLKKNTVGNDLMEFCLNPEKQKEYYNKRGNSIRERKLAGIRMDIDPSFLSGSCSLISMMALYYNSPLHHIIDNLLHGLKNFDENEKKSLKQSLSPSHNSLNYFPIRGTQIGYRFGQSGSKTRTTHVLRDESLAHSPYNLRNTIPQQDSSSSTFSSNKYIDGFSGGIGPNSWHVDGLMGGIYGSFSLLMAVPLSDQDNPFMGNFCVHPESHSELLPYLRHFYYKSEQNKDKLYAERERGVNSIPKPKLKDGIMVSAKKGDVILAFHKTAHLGGPNFSERVRKMAFFRTSHINHNSIREQTFDNFVIEYEGMQQVLFK